MPVESEEGLFNEVLEEGCGGAGVAFAVEVVGLAVSLVRFGLEYGM